MHRSEWTPIDSSATKVPCEVPFLRLINCYVPASILVPCIFDIAVLASHPGQKSQIQGPRATSVRSVITWIRRFPIRRKRLSQVLICSPQLSPLKQFLAIQCEPPFLTIHDCSTFWFLIHSYRFCCFPMRGYFTRNHNSRNLSPGSGGQRH